MKTCSKCGERKQFSEFGPKASNRDGLRHECRTCRAVHESRNRKADPAYSAKARARSAKRRASNPEIGRSHSRKYYATHAGVVADRQRNRRAQHPEINVVQLARRRARVLSANGRGVTAAQWQQILADSLGLCAYCNERPAQLTMDHIEPLARGGAHDVDNIAAACQSCNSAKGVRPLAVFLASKNQPTNSMELAA